MKIFRLSNNLELPDIAGLGSGYSKTNIYALIMCLIVISIPILIPLLFSLFKANLGKKSLLFLYSFTTGFFLIIGILGEINEGISVINENYTNHVSEKGLIGIKIGVVAGTAMLTLIGALGFKFFITRRLQMSTDKSVVMHNKHYHNNRREEFHDHVHGEELLIAPIKKKWDTKVIAVFLILSHRLIAGYFLGYSVYQLANGNPNAVTIGFLVTFFLHLIPEEAIIYYRLRQMNKSRFESLAYSVGMILILIPFVFLGANIGANIDTVPWLQSMMHVLVGSLFIFTALVEFIPEIIAQSRQQKLWYLTIIALVGGILAALIILNSGDHDHGHNAAENLVSEQIKTHTVLIKNF